MNYSPTPFIYTTSLNIYYFFASLRRYGHIFQASEYDLISGIGLYFKGEFKAVIAFFFFFKEQIILNQRNLIKLLRYVKRAQRANNLVTKGLFIWCNLFYMKTQIHFTPLVHYLHKTDLKRINIYLFLCINI